MDLFLQELLRPLADQFFHGFAVFDQKTEAVAVWDTKLQEYRPSTAVPAMTGIFSVTLASGKTIACTTVWD